MTKPPREIIVNITPNGKLDAAWRPEEIADEPLKGDHPYILKTEHDSAIAAKDAEIAKLKSEVELLTHARDRECGHCHRVLTEGTFCSDSCREARRDAIFGEWDE